MALSLQSLLTSDLSQQPFDKALIATHWEGCTCQLLTSELGVFWQNKSHAILDHNRCIKNEVYSFSFTTVRIIKLSNTLSGHYHFKGEEI